MIQYFKKLFSVGGYDKSSHRKYTLYYEDLCQ